MYYFDANFLKKYLDVAPNGIQVYDGKGWYTIPEKSDLRDDEFAMAYDPANEFDRHEVDYKSITKVKVGDNVYTRDQLNKLYSDEEDVEKDDTDQPESEEGGEEEPAPPEIDDETGEPDHETTQDSVRDQFDQLPVNSGNDMTDEFSVLFEQLHRDAKRINKKIKNIFK